MTKVITRVHPVYLINVHCVPKTSTFLFFQQLCQTLIDCNILRTLNPEKIDTNTLQICPEKQFTRRARRSSDHRHRHRHRHRVDKYLEIRRPVATAADRVATDHSGKSKPQDGRLPELLLV